MKGRPVIWEPGMDSLGAAVVAIGVFDGVHLGHQALLRAAVTEAHRIGARAVALTFDRDPDQVVTPDAAAAQLLTLEDKCRFIAACGVHAVLVVPFDERVATTPAEEFLDEVLCCAMDVKAIHVGHDFRFGAGARGDVDTLYVWGVENGAEVRPHGLVEIDDETVSSTRIRTLVAAGEVERAAELLGRPTRVAGRVVRGRAKGRELGFPTANVRPVPFPALPSDGIYAGYVEVPPNRIHPAAIAVGKPPSFPEARDYLEAHLIGFDGDLYDTDLVISFTERLRDQKAFGSLDELSAAIAADVERVASSAAAAEAAAAATFVYGEDQLDDGPVDVDDPVALAAAEKAVAQIHKDPYTSGEQWVPVTGPRHISSLFGEAGYNAAMIAAPLDARGIPYAWDPYPPEQMPSFRYGYGATDRPFVLLVPVSKVDEARHALGVAPDGDALADMPSGVDTGQLRPRPPQQSPGDTGPIMRDSDGLTPPMLALLVLLILGAVVWAFNAIGG